MAAPQKIKTRITIRSNNFTSGYINQGIESMVSNISLYTDTHGSIAHESKNVETIINRCPSTDEEISEM